MSPARSLRPLALSSVTLVLGAWSSVALVFGTLSCLVLAAPSPSAQCETARGSSPIQAASFGASLAIDGDRVVVGTGSGGFGGDPCFLFDLDDLDGGATAELAPDNSTTIYGWSVAIQGDTVVVAGQDVSDPTLMGYVFQRVGAEWVFAQHLVVPISTVQFGDGLEVSLEGDLLVLSDLYWALVNVFRRVDGVWTLQDSFTADEIGVVGAYAMSSSLLDGRLVVSGVVNVDGAWIGKAWIYEEQAGAFVEVDTLVADDGQEFDQMGLAMAQSEDVIVLGAPYFDFPHGLGRGGVAYVFERVDGEWMQTDTLSAPEPVDHGFFGHALAIQGDLLFVGEPRSHEVESDAGAVHVFQRGDDGWDRVRVLTADVPVVNACFGSAVAVTGDTLLVGAEHAGDSPGVFRIDGVAAMASWGDGSLGLAGADGTPCAYGLEPPSAGGPAGVRLVGAAADASAWWVASLDRINAPFKGGVLVPAPDLLVPFATAADGGGALDWSWPAGLPSGFRLWLQAWVADGGAPAGFAASGGLSPDIPGV